MQITLTKEQVKEVLGELRYMGAVIVTAMIKNPERGQMRLKH